MSLPSDFRPWSSPHAQQILFLEQTVVLLILLIVLVLLVLILSKVNVNYIFVSAVMVLETLGNMLPWSWSPSHLSGFPVASTSDRKKGKRKHGVRSRAEQGSAANGSAKHDHKRTEDAYFPGLVNISGTYCFMNATIQALASLSYLQPHLDAIHAKAEALDVPTPVIDALRDILRSLNTPTPTPAPIRPTALIYALSNHSPKLHSLTLFSSREHQDAQELFQLLSECVKSEGAAVDKENHRDPGLGGLTPAGGSWQTEIGKNPFDGLTANRRSCVECGYTEAVMHFAFDNWQLAVPSITSNCQLEECLADYTRLEVLTDCICRKCSLLATHKRLQQEADKLAEIVSADPSPSLSRRKKVKEARKLVTRVKAALEQGRIEDDIKGVKMEKIFSKASTKQAMIARPPPVLALHINRSMHYGQYVTKNPIRLIFPELLDLTPFTTSGNLSTVPSVPLSTQPPRSATPTPSTIALTRSIYRLQAVVCHYGQHSFGHYVCLRRKPSLTAGALGEGGADSGGVRAPEWLRVSDDAVRECALADVLAEGSGAFMLYYEKVSPERRQQLSPRSSEETLKPEMKLRNGSSVSLVSVASGSSSPGLDTGVVAAVGSDAAMTEGKGATGRPRIVRRVVPGRGRSLSVGPSVGSSSAYARGSHANGGGTASMSVSMSILNGEANGSGKFSSLENGSLQEAQRPTFYHSPAAPVSSPSLSPSPPPPMPIETPKPMHPPATVWT